MRAALLALVALLQAAEIHVAPSAAPRAVTAATPPVRNSLISLYMYARSVHSGQLIQTDPVVSTQI